MWGTMRSTASNVFHFVMIKPTHYDDDGYPIQWFRSAIPSNTLACLNGLAEDARRREVLVRTAAAGLCHSDLHFIEGAYPTPVPVVLGHESAGVVEAVGEDVTYVKPGDHVISCLSVFCGTCDNCTTGRTVLCTDTTVKMLPGASNRLSWARSEKLNQFLNLSSFAEQMLVHENAIVKIRKDMPLELAALIGCGVITGYGAVVNTAGVKAGETVAVIGCGGVGMAAINGAAIARVLAWV